MWDFGNLRIFYGDDSGGGDSPDSTPDNDPYGSADFSTEAGGVNENGYNVNEGEGNYAQNPANQGNNNNGGNGETNPDGTSYGEPDSFGRLPTDPGYGTKEETNPGVGGNAGAGNTPIDELQEKIDDHEIASVDTTLSKGDQWVLDTVRGIMNGGGLISGLLPDMTDQEIIDALGLVGGITQPVSYFNPDGSPGLAEPPPGIESEADDKEDAIPAAVTGGGTPATTASIGWQNPDLTAIQDYLDTLKGISTTSGKNAAYYNDVAKDLLERYGLSMGANAGETLDLATAAANRNAQRTAADSAKEAARQSIIASRTGGLNSAQAGIAAGRDTGGSYTDTMTALFPELLDRYQTAADSFATTATSMGGLGATNTALQTDATNSALAGVQNEQQMALNELLGKLGIDISQQGLNQQEKQNTLNLVGTLLAALGVLI